MRLHGNRYPKQPKVGEGGGSGCLSGADNEVWSFGDENYPILVRYMRLRERMRGYIRDLMKEASDTGAPVIRTMFFEFPEDDYCWQSGVETQYMFGSKYLCAPILEPGIKTRSVYLPKGARWALLKVGEKEDGHGKELDGGQTVEVATPIEDMPVFVKLR
jgi:alpha-D-xyloside xylohydrolase